MPLMGNADTDEGNKIQIEPVLSRRVTNIYASTHEKKINQTQDCEDLYLQPQLLLNHLPPALVCYIANLKDLQ